MWIYNNNNNIIKITSLSNIPEEYNKAIGFIYQITQISTGKKYIGRKMLYENKTTKGIKTKNKVETNWLNYNSSSDKLKHLIEQHGKCDFKHEILVFCFTKSQMLYAEEYYIYKNNAIISNDYFNENIRAKIYKKWFEKESNENILFKKQIIGLM